MKGWFDEYLEDIPTLLQNIQLHYKKQLTPRRSLIIFDEVQKCPRAREAIKALVEDGRFDYLETGSLISIKKNVENIVIPSEEDGIDMYPMDFEEFLWAMGNEVMMPYIRERFEKRQPMGEFHREALHYFRQYLIVGGMPQAVAEYVSSRDFKRVDAVKRQILRLYKNDIKKYAGTATARVSAIYDAIPGQLQNFYSNYDKEAAENRMQVDFLIQKEVVTSRHNISPIEVKSSTGYTLTSIQKCIKKFGQYLSTPYVLHTKDVELNRRQAERHPSSLGDGRGAKEEGEANDGLVYLPLYMTGVM